MTLSSQHALIALQLLNAIFIGIVAGIGMSHFQDLMPGAPGWRPRSFQQHPHWLHHGGGHRGDGGGAWSFHGVHGGGGPGADGAGRLLAGPQRIGDAKEPMPGCAGTSAPVVRGRSGLTWGCLPWYSMRRQRSSSSAAGPSASTEG